MDTDVLKHIGDLFAEKIFNGKEGKNLLKGFKEFPEIFEDGIKNNFDKFLIEASIFFDRRINPDFENDPKEICEYLKDRFFKAL